MAITNERKAISVFVLVNFCGKIYSSGLFEVKILEQGGRVVTGSINEPLAPIFKFFDTKDIDEKLPYFYTLLGAKISSDSRLYLLLQEGHQGLKRTTDGILPSYRGYVFDTKARALSYISAPRSSKPVGLLISAYGKLYSIEMNSSCETKTPFECYDPAYNTWDSLPLPYSQSMASFKFTGYAVCYGCILLSIPGCGVSGFMLYHIATQTWHPVTISGSQHGYGFLFRGRAVIVENTIYAVSRYEYGNSGIIVSFSLNIDSADDGRVVCSLEKRFVLPPLDSGLDSDEFCDSILKTEYLVHLGKFRFCLIQSFFGVLSSGRQELWTTTFEIVGGGGEIKILHSVCHTVDTFTYGRFSADFSFISGFADFEPPETNPTFRLFKKEKAKADREYAELKGKEIHPQPLKKEVGCNWYFEPLKGKETHPRPLKKEAKPNPLKGKETHCRSFKEQAKADLLQLKIKNKKLDQGTVYVEDQNEVPGLFANISQWEIMPDAVYVDGQKVELRLFGTIRQSEMILDQIEVDPLSDIQGAAEGSKSHVRSRWMQELPRQFVFEPDISESEIMLELEDVEPKEKVTCQLPENNGAPIKKIKKKKKKKKKLRGQSKSNSSPRHVESSSEDGWPFWLYKWTCSLYGLVSRYAMRWLR